MEKELIEEFIISKMKSIYGFALKRCNDLQDAEDLSQEIIYKTFKALKFKNNIENLEKFLWTIAHHTLANYYREKNKIIIETLTDEQIFINQNETENKMELMHLQSEIAYLSKMQRKIIIAYYFENKTQKKISSELNLPIGTVKWHLFEAKKDLKKGMKKMRKSSQLKFNPIHFNSYHFNGTKGTKSLKDIFRSTLVQNICYCVRNEEKTFSEIADCLGVSPVFIETEVEFLKEYGLLKENKDKYIANFIIYEPTTESLQVQNKIYDYAAELIANELFENLNFSKLVMQLVQKEKLDKNFLLWTLIPFIAAYSGEELRDDKISFEEVATMRPDGGYNIITAEVLDNVNLPNNYLNMKKWRGPMSIYDKEGKNVFWQIDNEWTNREIKDNTLYEMEIKKVLSLYNLDKAKTQLSNEDYAWLAERGYIQIDNSTKEKTWKIVILDRIDLIEELFDIGSKIKSKYFKELSVLKENHCQNILKNIPIHLKRVEEYQMQYTFYADGLFLYHCLQILLKNGSLKLPSNEEKRMITTMIYINN